MQRPCNICTGRTTERPDWVIRLWVWSLLWRIQPWMEGVGEGQQREVMPVVCLNDCLKQTSAPIGFSYTTDPAHVDTPRPHPPIAIRGTSKGLTAEVICFCVWILGWEWMWGEFRGRLFTGWAPSAHPTRSQRSSLAASPPRASGSCG